MRTKATLVIHPPEGIRASDITRRLDLQPSRSFEVGDQMGKRWPDKVRKHAMWSISSSGSPEVGVEIYEQLHKLLDIIQPHADTLWSLANDGATCMICCYLGSAAYEHMAIIDRGTMNRLLLVPGDLWLDVYGEEPEDLI